MDYNFERKWQETLKNAEEAFGQPVDLQSLLFLIGLQELGKGFRKYSKDEKMSVLHIATCRVLEPYGYYKFVGLDQEGWPHFENLKPLPPLQANDQERLMKEAIIEYLDY
ncbi:hypothetical protein [Luteibaculum oceani]|uniref:Uncharacterized protein n=1 Tax=Luteibaculum oceani TaxID=1294296 RepID=A0A5C6VNX6_9FLAO|nr:hypothetical protein [Luteibaculum oceani]TXC85415.1 hypothetical protein FRX97_01960 [Luteibaculum oceani]